MQGLSADRGLVVDKMLCGQEKKNTYKEDEASCSIFE